MTWKCSRIITDLGTRASAEKTLSCFHNSQRARVHAASGLCIKPKTKPSRIETLKEMARAFGLDPEEILTKEALSMSNGTVITAGKATSEGQMDTLLHALKQKLKEDPLEKPVATRKTV